MSRAAYPLQQRAEHLLAGAMEGGGCIHLRVRDTRDSQTGTIRGIVIFVQDSGSGMARAHLRSIFLPLKTGQAVPGLDQRTLA